MDNLTNQNIPPILPPQQQNTSSNISWLKTLAYGFSLVSFGIAIGIGGYILATQRNQPVSQNQQVASPTTNQPSPTPLPSKASVAEGDPTADWKTYTNTKIGFQIKYPPRYSQALLPSGLGPSLYADGSEDNTRIIFGEKSTDSVGLQVFPFKGSLDELINYNKTPSYDSNSKLTLIKTLRVDGNDARWYTAMPPTVYPEDEGKTGLIKIYFIGNNHGFILDANINHSQNEINQILSTFKFTE